jgi:hypothetical protein
MGGGMKKGMNERGKNGKRTTILIENKLLIASNAGVKKGMNKPLNREE